MARIKKSRTLTLSDDVFEGLQALAMYRKYKGETDASASKIIEALATDYLKGYQKEIALIQSGKEAMENQIQRQLTLFDVDDDGNVTYNFKRSTSDGDAK